MQSLKYGLVTTAGYVTLLTVLLALIAWIEGSGISCFDRLTTPFYILLMTFGGLVAFFAGFCFQHIFSRIVADYTSEYPDVPIEYVMQICRGKLMGKYCYNLAIGCFIVAPYININTGKSSTIATYYLISIGICFAIAYTYYKRKYKNL